MKSFKKFLAESESSEKFDKNPNDDVPVYEPQIEESELGVKIKTPYGYIDYTPKEDVNEIWWVESKKKGHGSELVNLMQKRSPTKAIAWGVTSKSGEGLRKKWHRNNPDIESITGAHEGQYDPFEHQHETEGEGE
jgi:hypothetical protein